MRDNYPQYKFYHEMATRILEDGANLEELLNPAHFICEASRINKKGLSGQAHSHWVSGLFDQGVYLFAENYNLGLKITEAPDIKATTGCQNSCAYGDPWPKPTKGEWVREKDIPEAARAHVSKICRAMVEESALLITKRAVILAEQMVDRQIAEEGKKDRVLVSWGVA